jgi:hypothetical protein
MRGHEGWAWLPPTLRGASTGGKPGCYCDAGDHASQWADGGPPSAPPARAISTSLLGSRTTLAWYDAASAAASQLGQGIFIVSGRIMKQDDAEGTLVAATARGHIVDVCAALS